MLYSNDKNRGMEIMTQGYFCEDDYSAICCMLDVQEGFWFIDQFLYELFGSCEDSRYNTEVVEMVRRRLKEDYTLIKTKSDFGDYTAYNWCHALDSIKFDILKKIEIK